MKNKCSLKRFLITIQFVALINLLTISIAHAEYPGTITNAPPTKKFFLRIGNFNIDQVNSTIRLDSSSGFVGTIINLEDDLGVSNSNSDMKLDGYYRFNDHHQINFSHYNKKRSGTSVIDKDINFLDESFSINRRLLTEIENEIYELSYSYSIIAENRIQFNIGGGLRLDDVSIELKTIDLMTGSNDSTKGSGDLLLPFFTFSARYYFTPRLSFTSNVKQFLISTNDIKGVFSDLELALEYNAFENTGFGLSFNKINSDLESKNSRLPGEYEVTESGFFAYISIYL